MDDIEDDWNYSTPFDLIFARFMTGSVLNWPRFFKQAFDNLNPGGTIELHDVVVPSVSDDGSQSKDSAISQWCALLNEGFTGIGRPMDSALQYERQLAEAGFTNLGVVHEKWPMNQWPRDRKHKQIGKNPRSHPPMASPLTWTIGIWNSENMPNVVSAFSLAVFTRPKSEGGLGWSREQAEVLFASVRRDMRNTDIHSYFRV